MNFFLLFNRASLKHLPLIWRVLFLASIIVFFLLTISPLYYQLIFSWDQARDAFEAYAIWHNFDFKILGPSTDFPGFYHGVIWYYLLAIPYAISQGNVLFTAYTFLIFHFITIFFVGHLSYELFGNKKNAMIAMTLYAFSPLVHAFTRWLSNPVISIFITPYILISLWKYLHKGGWKWAGTLGICMGLLVQSDAGFAMFYLLIPLYLIVFRKLPTFSDMGAFLVTSVITLSTYLIAELKFNFRATWAIISFFHSSHANRSSINELLLAILNKFIDLLRFTLLPMPRIYILSILAAVLLIIVVKRYSKEDSKPLIFLGIWLVNIILFRLFSTGLTNSNFVFAPSVSVIATIGAYILTEYLKKPIVLLSVMAVLCFFQIVTIVNAIYVGTNPLAVQHGMTYYDGQKIIDYTYTKAKERPFAIHTVTNPLFINTVWAYHYEFYGKKKYHYVPFFDGKSQNGYLGNLPLLGNNNIQQYFLILEPTPGIPEMYFAEARSGMDVYSSVRDKKSIGTFTVEIREHITKSN
ncbi:hypothetical protein BH11PAT1_BH11PAT1_1320 [soil metagenome]